jgi:hypothetical protein
MEPHEHETVLVGAQQDMFAYVDVTLASEHPAGYTVEARDGDIGKVDKHSNEPGSAYLVVDIGPWIFGKTVVIPAAMIERVDHDTQTVFVGCTKDQIKHAPEYDDKVGVSESYRRDLGSYYGGLGS